LVRTIPAFEAVRRLSRQGITGCSETVRASRRVLRSLPQHEVILWWPLREFLIQRKLRSSCLEGRTMLTQLNANFLTASFARTTNI
jgi:hypothetical protein